MIRRMEPHDLDACINIWLQSNLSAHDFIPATYWSSHLDYMREVLPQAEVWVYCIADKVNAFIGLDSEYIAGLFVDEKFRSQDIGHRLINHVKSQHHRLTLCVFEKNQRAINFYIREGFTDIKHRIDESTNEMEIVMQWS